MMRIEMLKPRCTRCGEMKPRRRFAVRTNGYLASWCRDCHAEHARNVSAAKREQRIQPEQFACTT